MLLSLARKSLWNRRLSLGLTACSISLSLVLLLGVERLSAQVRESFTQTVSGTDLIVGARSGAIQLLLYSVFRIGDATANISWQSYEEIAAHPSVAWTIPLSLGDSHRGYRVLGTSSAYFEHYRYARDAALAFSAGRPFEDIYDVVLGAEVARALGYRLGDSLVLAHGTGATSFTQHKDNPFQVAGILTPTGTPVDRSLHVSLAAIEAIHADWHHAERHHGARPGQALSAEDAQHPHLHPEAVTAVLVGLQSPVAAFQLQRVINDYRKEPLSAILPALALQQLWESMAYVERALLILSGFVVAVGLIGLLTSLLTSLNERRREMALLRSVGAGPRHIFGLLLLESLLVTALGCLAGIAILYFLLWLGQPLLQAQAGIGLRIGLPGRFELLLLGAVMLAAALIGCIPAWRAYRRSLADGLAIRG